MRQHLFVLLGTTALLTVSACSKHVPVAAKPAPPVPVEAASAPKPAPVVARASGTPAPVAQRVAQAGPATMSQAERETLNDRLARMEDALFDYDKATIRIDATSALKDDVSVIRGILASYPSQKLVIEGHADERGSAEYNEALGDKRAQAASEFLVQMGIPQVQLTIISYGKERPVCTEDTEACWQKNRRAHIVAAR